MKIKKEKLKIRGLSFKRYNDHSLNIMRHSIELYMEGEIPSIGLSSKEIIKLLKKY